MPTPNRLSLPRHILMTISVKLHHEESIRVSAEWYDVWPLAGTTSDSLQAHSAPTIPNVTIHFPPDILTRPTYIVIEHLPGVMLLDPLLIEVGFLDLPGRAPMIFLDSRSLRESHTITCDSLPILLYPPSNNEPTPNNTSVPVQPDDPAIEEIDDVNNTHDDN
ncbi:hypothetical protein FKP32DRAFT_1674323 [Trametes sanguinea]|nr:hypothetical protein FKP32DRAFT_1674323 [Trametes sanguinea]